MGRRNFLIEGVPATRKTAVGEELAARGHHVVHRDRELAYQGAPAPRAPPTAMSRITFPREGNGPRPGAGDTLDGG